MIDRQSLHRETNENGVKLINFAAGRNMVISSTYYSHKDIHKATWTSPDGVTENKIDLVLIDRRHVMNIMHGRSCKGADVYSFPYMIRVK
ncbi:uncharacterized protein CDAR_77181 [Caerostris darwini]|uniref:Uncharacterized protein n=1 Tax=Caerostris darwini TaxID=1538125 RepID=A0AAV4SJI4_9ARAC|nr:uncharacterized protein CDAR_77181 [Caerostris darwini]